MFTKTFSPCASVSVSTGWKLLITPLKAISIGARYFLRWLSSLICARSARKPWNLHKTDLRSKFLVAIRGLRGQRTVCGQAVSAVAVSLRSVRKGDTAVICGRGQESQYYLRSRTYAVTKTVVADSCGHPNPF